MILISVCSLLNRPRNATHFRTKEWRFIQSFISKCPGKSVLLTFPEAVSLPSLYYQSEEGSFCGAVPSVWVPPTVLPIQQFRGHFVPYQVSIEKNFPSYIQKT